MAYTVEEKAIAILKLCPGIELMRFAIKLLGGEALMKRGNGDGKQLSLAAKKEIQRLQKDQMIKVVFSDLYPNGVVYLFGRAPKAKRFSSSYKPLECKAYTLDDLPREGMPQSQPAPIRRSIDWDKAERLERMDRQHQLKENQVKLIKTGEKTTSRGGSRLAAAESLKQKAAARLQKALEIIEQAADQAIATRQPMPSRREIAILAGYCESWLQHSSHQNGRNRDEAAIAYGKALERVQSAIGHDAATPLPRNSMHEFVIQQIEIEKEKAIADGLRMASRSHICEMAGVSQNWFYTKSRAAERANNAYRQAFRDVQEANRQNRKSA